MRTKILQNFYNQLKISSYSYSPPSRIGTLIYDFYFLESIHNLDISPNREDVELYSFYESTLSQVLDLVKNLFVNERMIFTAVLHLQNNLIKDDAEDFARFQNWYLENFQGDIEEYQKIENTFLTEDYLDHKSNVPIEDLEVFMQILLLYADSIGSTSAWQNVYSSIKDLQNTASISQKILATDHLIDIAHNSGSIFEYIDLDNVNEIETALDNKFNFGSLEDFLPYISPSLKPFAIKVIYNLTGRTEEMRQ